MSNPSDMNTPENLDLIGEVTKAIQAQTRALEALSGALGKQASMSQAASEGAKKSTQSETVRKDATAAVTEAMREQSDGADGLSAALGRQSTAGKKVTGSNEEQVVSWIKVGESIAQTMGIVAAMGEAFNATKVVMSMGLNAITGGFSILKAGIGLVLSPFQGLMSMAADYANQNAEAAWAANQKLTASFGDAEGATGSFVKTMKKDLGGASGELSKAGNSMWAAIGNGPAILQEAIKIAEGFGNSLVSLKGQIKGATDEMFLMSRGMNMSADALKNMAINAKASGGSFEESMQEGMVASAHLANKFGLDVKDIGKNMNIMQKDMATFGHMAPKELAAVAAYSSKLGVSIEALGKTMSAFDTFESAAGNAGKLAEAFGMNVDVMKMMNAENPAERMDMLRKSFEETGKSVSDLSRHEMKLLSESMGGMPIDELKAGLSMSSDELGFGDFADAAEEAAQKVSPEEAMEKVAKSIEKLNKVLAKMTGGPLTDFINGFKHGLLNSKEFKGILGDIGEWLTVFKNAGIEIGKLFAQIFLKDGSKFKSVIEGIFNIEKAKDFMAMVKAAFKALFGGLEAGGDPGQLAADFFDNMMSAFKKWIGGTGDGGLGSLLKDMVTGAFKMLGAMAPKIIEEAAKYIELFATSLADFLDSDTKTQDTIGTGLIGAMSNAFTSIKDSLIDKLLPALGSLFMVLMERFGPTLLAILVGVYTVIFVKSIISSMVTAGASALLQAGATQLVKKMGGMMGKATKQEKVNGKATEGLKDVGKALGGKNGLLEMISKIKKSDIKKAGKNLLHMGLYLVGGMILFAGGMVAVATILNTVSWNALGKGIVGLTAAVLASVPMVYAAIMMEKSKAKWMDLAKALVGAAGLFLVGGVALAGAMWVLAKAWSVVDVGASLKALGTSVDGTFVGCA